VGKHPTTLRDNFLAYERQPELIGGYAVVKKWLSYPEKELLGNTYANNLGGVYRPDVC
jgi:hypothetical protein